jgi:hypothetical protein
MVEEIKRKAQEVANKNREAVIMGVYRNMVNSHHEHCGCNYCTILTHYIQMKKYLSAQHRRMNDPEYDFWNNEEVEYDLNTIKRIKQKIKSLKREKDELKQF